MTNASEIIDRALFPMRDQAGAYFDSDTELLGFLNDAQIDLAARERLFRATEFVGTAIDTEGAYFDLPTIMLAPRWVKDSNGNEVGQLDESTFFEYQHVIPEDAETYICTYYKDRCWLWPQPVVSSVFNFGYYAMPPALTDTADDIALGRQWEEKLVRYVRSECYARLGDIQLSAIDKAAYEKGLRPAQAAVDRMVPGKVSFAIEPGPFDLMLDATQKGR